MIAMGGNSISPKDGTGKIEEQLSQGDQDLSNDVNKLVKFNNLILQILVKNLPSLVQKRKLTLSLLQVENFMI